MNYDWETSLRASEYQSARVVPPAALDETSWDILLALHRDRHCDLTLGKLASVVSAPEAVMYRWLANLEHGEFITAAQHRSTGEFLAMLTQKGRELLDRYFSVTRDLQLGAH